MEDTETIITSKVLGDVVIIQSNRIAITNKAHLNAFNRKRDTLCGKNFAYPDGGTYPLYYEDGTLKLDGSPLFGNYFNKEFMCSRCLEIFENYTINKIR